MKLPHLKPTVLVKMMARSLVVLAVSILLVEYISYRSSSRQIIGLTEERAQNLTTLYAERFDRIFNDVEIDLLTIRNLPSLRDYFLNRQYDLYNEADQQLFSVGDFLSQLYRRNSAYARIVLTDNEGAEVLSVVEGISSVMPTVKPIEARSLWSRSGEIPATRAQGPIKLPGDGEEVLWFRMMLGTSSQSWGHVTIFYSLTALLSDLRTVQLFDTGRLSVYRRDGIVIHDPDISPGDNLIRRNSRLATAILRIDQPRTVQLDLEAGDSFLISASPMMREPWIVAALAREDEMLAKLNDTRDMIIVLIVIAVLLEVLAVSVFTRRLVVAPIKKLLDGISEVAAGNHDHRVDVSSSDEFGQLGRSFNRMTMELKQRDSRIEEGELRFRIIAETSPVALAIAAEEGGDVMFANQAWFNMFGMNRSDLNRFKAEDIYWDRRQRDDIIRRIQTGEQVRNEEIKFRNAGGEPVIALLSAREIVYDSRKAMLAIVIDYTERKHLEEQLRQSQKMDAIGQLTGGVAHDFNNLLAVILGNAELLTEADQEAGITSNPRLDAIMRSAQRGAELTQRLLAFSRKQSLEPQIVRLDKLIHGMEDLLHRALGETIDLNIVDTPDLHASKVDPGQVENAVLNLCINARDAMPEGGKITIETSNAHVGPDHPGIAEGMTVGDYVLLTVTDTGVGIPAEVLERVFEPFFTTKEVGKGTGLGLSMVYGFARQSGGNLCIDSEPGKGTTVSLFLPEAEQREADQDTSKSPCSPVTEDRVVLVVEDDEDVRELAINMLQSLGCATLAVRDGFAAMDVLRRRSDVDILLTDIVLPGGMDGPAIAGEAKALHADIKILYMSGYPDSSGGDPLADLADGPLLHKPFSKSVLADKLNELIEQDNRV